MSAVKVDGVCLLRTNKGRGILERLKFWLRKTLGCSKIMACPHGHAGLRQCVQRWRRVNFVRTSVMEGPFTGKETFKYHMTVFEQF